MKLIENTVGNITFILTVGSYDGDLIEKVTDFKPFEFVFGTGTMLQSFENNLRGLSEDEEFKFMIPKEEAYGVYLPEMQIELEKQFLVDQIGDPEMVEEELQLDNYIPMLDPDGNTLNGKVIFIGDDKVKLDFNHPLADMDLYFTGKVLGLRAATAGEIKDGRVLNATQWENAGPDDPMTCHI